MSYQKVSKPEVFKFLEVFDFSETKLLSGNLTTKINYSEIQYIRIDLSRKRVSVYYQLDQTLRQWFGLSEEDCLYFKLKLL